MKSFVIVTYYHLSHAIAMALELKEKPNLYFITNYLKPSTDFVNRIKSVDVFNDVILLDQSRYMKYMLPALEQTKGASESKIDEIGSSIFDRYMEPYFSEKFRTADFDDEIFVYTDFQWDYYYISKHFENIVGVEDGYGILDKLGEFQLSESRKLREPFIGKYYPEALWKFKNVKKIISSVQPKIKVPEHEGKVEIIDYNELVERHFEEHNNIMLGLFNLDNLNIVPNSVLYLTQPLDKSMYCDEKDNFIFNKIIIDREVKKGNHVYIKPHPAEFLNYNIFAGENVTVLDKAFPVELLNCYGDEFSKALTFCSTSVYTLKSIKKKETLISIEDLTREKIVQYIQDIIESTDTTDFEIPKQIKNRGKINKGILDYYFGEKVQNDTVFLEGLGKWNKGNMIYVVKELQSEKYKHLKLFYSVTKETEDITRNYFESIGIDDMEYVIAGSGKYRKVLSFAKYLINEVDFPNYWIKKKEQVYINIWHGTPLKKLGIAREDKKVHNEGNHQRNFVMADYILCPNDYTKNIILDDYCVRDLTCAKLIMKGYPRTGELLSNKGQSFESNGKQIIAFMPTWREGEKKHIQIEKLREFFTKIDSKLNEDQIMYVNLHHLILKNISLEKYKKIKFFPKEYEVYQFLKNVDVLITDYSSIMFDFAVTRKNIILHCSDLKEYSDDRGFYFDIHQLPFPITTTVDSLITEIGKVKLGIKDYDDSMFIDTFCNYDSAANTEFLCKAWINSDYKNIVIEEPVKTNKKNVLIYSDAIERGYPTDYLYEYYSNHSDEDYNAFLSYKNTMVEDNSTSAYPLIEDVKVLGCKGSNLFSQKQKTLKKQYNNGTLSYKNLMKKIDSAYDCEFERRYPGCNFDCIIMYDCIDGDTLRGFAHFKSRKILVLHDRMIYAAEYNSNFKADLEAYIKTCEALIFVTKADLQYAKKICKMTFKKKLLMENAREFEEYIKSFIM